MSGLQECHADLVLPNPCTFALFTVFPFSSCIVECAGVADGVGGWHKENVDPGEFAKQLMATAKRESRFLTICPTAPSYLMGRAHNGVHGMKVGTIPFASMSFMSGGQSLTHSKLNNS